MTSLQKNSVREIWLSKARFFSILAIIALGVGFFSGVKAVSPAMVKTAQDYYYSSELMDFNLLSSVGFDDDDVEEVNKIDGVTGTYAGYFSDVIVNHDDTGEVIRLYSFNDSVNKLTLTEGRLPEKSGEIVIDKKQLKKGYAIGDKISIKPTIGKTDTFTVLNTLQYTIVGAVSSPMYITFERGNTTVGDGMISSFAYIMPEDFAFERYTQVFVKTKYSEKEISPFSDEYKNGIADIKNKLEDLSEDRLNAFDTKYLSGQRQKLSDGLKEYEDKKAEAQKEFEQAQAKLDEGQAEYDNKVSLAESSLNSASSEVASGEDKLPQAIRDYYDGLTDAREQINDAELQLSEGKRKLEEAQKEYDDKISSAEKELQSGYEQYNEAYEEFYSYTKPQGEKKLEATGKLIDKAENTITELQEKLKDAEGEIAQKIKEDIQLAKDLVDSYKMEIEHGKEQLSQGEQKLIDTKTKLDNGQKQFDEQKESGATALAEAQDKINAGEAQLNEAKSKYYSGKAEGKEKLDEAMAQLEEGKAQIESGKAELELQKAQGLEQLKQANEDLEKAKEEAQTKLDDAKTQLDDAQKQLDNYNKMKWYINTRDDNPGYSGFLEDTGRVDSVATVFPLFFLMVAALICFTTMTRMVEERRTEIGTFKALGYSSAKIISKYLFYSTSAGLLGCVLGIAVFLPILPGIIYNAYRLMYILPELEYVIPWNVITAGVIVAILCTSIVSAITCAGELKRRPAKLMRPKSPKSGKRILLERIGFIWKRFNFSSKVTARNLFRYKARLMMTVLGIAGCTALIIAGFGLKDAISTVVDRQYGSISLFNTVIVPKDSGSADELAPLKEKFADDSRLEAISLVAQNTVNADNDKVSEVQLIVPSNINEFKNIIDLHNRQSKEEYRLTDNGVVVTEKLASIMNLNIGDKITYKDNDTTIKAEISGISENYVYNYIFMSPKLYEKLYNSDVKYNMFLGILSNENDQSEYAQELLSDDDIAAVTFTDTGISNVKNLLNGLNTIVFVMVLCAGMLAFVVLYNLININIAERQREIATIKVLGFYNKEVGGYVYRESAVLTILGIAVGLVLGIALNSFIIQTVEIDKVMFGREIFPQSFFYAIGLTMLFSFIVNWLMYFKMKAINMVESLKSTE